MIKFIGILGVILLLVIIFGVLFLVIAAMKRSMCEYCPHKEDCIKRENDKDFIPPCYKHDLANLMNEYQN